MYIGSDLTRNPRTLSEPKWENIRKQQIKGDKYTIPRVRYKYEEVAWKLFLDNTYDGYRTVRSSFIPYVIKDGKRYWLLGSFHDFPRDILMDFGGSCIIFDPPRKQLKARQRQHRYYQHQFGCAMLELNEESKGLLVQPVLKSLGENKPVIYRGADNKKREYVWFVMVELEYNKKKDIPDKFEKAPYVLRGEKLGPLDFYEESYILSQNSKYRTSRNLNDFVSYLQT